MVVDVSQVTQGGPAGGEGSQAPAPPSTQEAQPTQGGSTGQSTPTTAARPTPPASGGGGASGGGAAAETGPAAAQPQRPDLSGYSVQEILETHPGLQRYVHSRVGDLSRRQAEELAEQIVAERTAQSNLQREMQYRQHLRDNDPEAFARYDAEQEAKWRTETEVGSRVKAQTQREIWSGFDNMLFEIQFSLPIEAQREVEGRNFRDPSGDPWKSRQLYLKALQEAAIKHGVQSSLGPALTRAREDITSAARAEANGAVRGGGPSPNTQGGDAPSSEYVSQGEFDQHGRGNGPEARAWRAANRDRINRSIGTYITQ